MLKNTSKIFYKYMDKNLLFVAIYGKFNKKRGSIKILASVVVEILTDKDKQPIEARIVFVRDLNKNRKWLALFSTYTLLDEQEVVRIYGKRWDIESFFKISKSLI